MATHVAAPSVGKQRDVLRGVMVRTSDDVALVQDLPCCGTHLAHGFPVTPSFDALSYFILSWKVGFHTEVSSYVHDVRPLTYADTQSASDVVVVRLKQYRVAYAPDSSEDPAGTTHLVLVPYQFVKEQTPDPGSTFFLSDVYVDNRNGLPTKVTYSGGNDISFVCDYTMLDDHWLVNHVHYEETLHGPLRMGSLHVIADAVYDHFAFPLQAPDPRLAPPPSPPPGPTITSPPRT